jgi:DNA-directed RNA polymerase specialized sigma subunit
MTAEQYLENYKKLETMVANKRVERQRKLEQATDITSKLTDIKVKSSGSKQKVADAAIDCATIDKRIEELEAEMQEIIDTIEQLPELQYDILHKHYIQYMTLGEIANIRNYSKSWVEKTHRKALDAVESLLKSA